MGGAFRHLLQAEMLGAFYNQLSLLLEHSPQITTLIG
jgi:hypothetical protein